MQTFNFNLRGLTKNVMSALKLEAKRQKLSVNSLLIKMIENNLGYSHMVKRPIYHDLDKLAGTWSASDVKQFEKNIKDFEKIDREIWK